jgi:hypothetical protein
MVDGLHEMQKTPGLNRSKETIEPFTSSKTAYIYFTLFVEVAG